ncbi:hypothetical protein KIPB_002819, partial [Kipferlia bialata]|eukprot:g2819.t1
MNSDLFGSCPVVTPLTAALQLGTGVAEACEAMAEAPPSLPRLYMHAELTSPHLSCLSLVDTASEGDVLYAVSSGADVREALLDVPVPSVSDNVALIKKLTSIALSGQQRQQTTVAESTLR